jgi:hypothetical protein
MKMDVHETKKMIEELAFKEIMILVAKQELPISVIADEPFMCGVRFGMLLTIERMSRHIPKDIMDDMKEKFAQSN